jgi:hypothetical protein
MLYSAASEHARGSFSVQCEIQLLIAIQIAIGTRLKSPIGSASISFLVRLSVIFITPCIRRVIIALVKCQVCDNQVKIG